MEKFKPGKVFNPVKGGIKSPCLKRKRIEVEVPARLNTITFDVGKLVGPSEKKVYRPGEFALTAGLRTYAKVKVLQDGKKEVLIKDKTRRKAIVKHAAKIMQKALNVDDSFILEANNKKNYPHAGFGSSSSLITSVGISLDLIYSKPLSKKQLALYITQNHGEETKNEKGEISKNRLINVQCTGGSPLVALYSGGMQVISGRTQLIFREDIPEKFDFVFGIPISYQKYSAEELIEMEETTFSDMKKRSKNYSKEIAYKALHKLFPAIKNQDMSRIGDVIEWYRFKTESLKTDAKTWPELLKKMKKLKEYRRKETKIISPSSCGPAIFALTSNIEKTKSIFKEIGFKEIFTRGVNNTGYKVI